MVFVPGKMKFDHLEAVGAVLGIGDHMMPWGQAPGKGYAKRFYVDPTNGSDSNDGRSWAKPYATFEKAIDQARFPHGTTSLSYTDKSLRSFVFLAPGHYNEDADHASQFLWSGYNISVIGCSARPGKDYGVSFNYDGATASTAVMLINGSGNELANLHFYCDAAIPAIYVYFPGDNNWLHDLIIECDGTNCTYGVYATSMKGSLIERVLVQDAKTAGICAAYDAADQYAINGGIKDCKVYSSYSNTIGIKVAANLVVYNFWIERNLIQLASGSSCKGISCEANAMVVDNYVSVPTSADPIYHTGGDQYVMGNHTAAGTTNVDPEPAAG